MPAQPALPPSAPDRCPSAPRSVAHSLAARTSNGVTAFLQKQLSLFFDADPVNAPSAAPSPAPAPATSKPQAEPPRTDLSPATSAPPITSPPSPHATTSPVSDNVHAIHPGTAREPDYGILPDTPQTLRFLDPGTLVADPAHTQGPRIRLIHLEQQGIEYVLKRSRRRTIGFSISEQGLTVSAPRWVTLGDIETAIREKQRWICAKIVEMRAQRQRIPLVHWGDGGVVPYLGQSLILRTASSRVEDTDPNGNEATAITGAGATAPLDTSKQARISHASPGRRATRATRAAVLPDLDAGHLRIVGLPIDAEPQRLKDLVQAWLQGEAQRIFSERLEHYGQQLGVEHRSLRLSAARTRWGSCTAEGHIRLNWRLVHFPISAIDYVVAHELAHLREMNHSPRFWQTVAQLFPDFEKARAHLKNPPPELLPEF